MEEAAGDAEEAEEGAGVEAEEAEAAAVTAGAATTTTIAAAVPSVMARSRTMVVSPTSVRSSLLARTAMLP